MDIYKIRKAKKEDKLELLVEELWKCDSYEAPFHLEELERILRTLKDVYFRLNDNLEIIELDRSELGTEKVVISEANGKIKRSHQKIGKGFYNAYDFVVDYLGIGAFPAIHIAEFTMKYRGLPDMGFNSGTMVTYATMTAELLMKAKGGEYE